MQQTHEIPPVVFADGYHCPRMDHLGAQKPWFHVEVDVLRMRGERVGNLREMVCEHRYACWRGGKVRMQMRDPFTGEKIRQISSLKKTLQKTPSRVEQRSEQGAQILQGMPTSRRDIRSQYFLAATLQREIGYFCSHELNVAVHGLVAGLFD